MVDDPRIDELLEELLDSNSTPEDVCRDSPELLPQVRAGWERIRILQSEVGDLFPDSDPAATEPGGRAAVAPPRIAGYEVGEELGRGGMGVVYKAWHRRLNRLVALKMLLAGPYARPHELERFLREAEAVAGLRHPNVVQVYDAGKVDGRPFFTMELVEGGSLAQKIAGVPQSAPEAAALVAMLADGIHAAHTSGIVHRDLKPANVLLTADGIPKVTDFGLARRLDGSAGLTLSGAPMGTPSYMAPEQARGEKGTLGPATDVYALGAILYELLTGRPPFRAETAAATLHEVINRDAVPPSRLNLKVPRDLETICLKCLHKNPRSRYHTAADLEEEFNRFLRGEAITARPEGPLERLARQVRRRPALAVGLASGLLLATALVGGGLWVRWEKSEKEQARVQLERLDQARRDRQLVAQLERIRLNRLTVVESAHEARSIKAEADRDYEAAFRQSGFGQVQDDPNPVGARVADSDIRKALLTALDDWAFCAAADEHRRQWVLAVARRADPDASSWRDQVRDPATWIKPEALAELARKARIADESVVLLVVLGDTLSASGQDATAYLREVRQAHPSDYSANWSLGIALRDKNLAESLRYFQVAEALRPGEIVPIRNLGSALLANGQVDESIACFQRAVDLAPANAAVHASLGHALSRKGRHDAAVRELRRAIDLDPHSAYFRTRLGQSLLDLGRVDEAIAESREAVRLDPTYARGHDVLGAALFTKRPSQEAANHLLEAIRLDPEDASAHNDLGIVLRAAGRLDAAVKHSERAVHIEPSVAIFHHNLALSLKAANRRKEAVDHCETALRIDPTLGPAHHALGVMLAEDRRMDEALAQLRQATKLDPENARAYAALGEALISQGRLTEAAATISRCVELFPKDGRAHAAAERQLAHCNALVVLDGRLAAVLQGIDMPADDSERLLFAKLCRITKRYAAAARLAADAFTRSPALAENLRSYERYDAACAAALAGCGQGNDAAALGDVERSRWRKQARAWLQSDLAGWAKKADGSAADRRLVQKFLTFWRVDPDLAGLREPLALGVLAEGERKDCLAFWAEVAAVLARTDK